MQAEQKKKKKNEYDDNNRASDFSRLFQFEPTTTFILTSQLAVPRTEGTPHPIVAFNRTRARPKVDALKRTLVVWAAEVRTL